MNKNIPIKPKLTARLSLQVFKNYYWDKKELLAFCRNEGLSTSGNKIDLINLVEYFLQTGKNMHSPKITRVKKWDSDNIITKNTQVIHYKNDAKTRAFFEKEIGKNFHFNSYLRQFGKKSNKDLNLTYADLIKGWKQVEQQKLEPSYKSNIEKQFEFNQFQRDFSTKAKQKTRKELIAAWKLIRSIPGPNTYDFYVKISKKLDL